MHQQPKTKTEPYYAAIPQQILHQIGISSGDS